ncbi:hypothetical protein VP01_3375g2 [Puccinia sorghi]|uniref:Probable cytosolic iron-sulfur protein assembly protein 1 n=1 Tax=Puccinia sorghi TaxID=27349 RepID=A0A0L6UWT2_9BASI|nr:hypothetical protein VP01_3375g2 [Puccinia sorghi]
MSEPTNQSTAASNQGAPQQDEGRRPSIELIQVLRGTSGDLLASGSFDSTASIWTNHHFEQKLTQAVLNSADGPERPNSPIIEGEIEGEESWECLMSLEGHESEVKGVSWNRNGNLLATCSRDKSVWIWEILTGNDSQEAHNVMQDDEGYEVISVLMEHEQDVKSVCWSPVEDLLCSTSYDNNIHLYAEDVTAEGDFTLLHRLKGHQSTVWDASFSPCGEFLASCSDDLSMRIWHREKLPQGGVEGRDGGLTGGWRIGRSERERWVCTSVLSGYHSRTIYSLDWTFAKFHDENDPQDLGMIVSCGGDGVINIFKLSKGVPVSGLDVSSPQPDVILLAQKKKGHGTSDINDVAWCKVKISAKGADSSQAGVHRLFASSGDDGSAKERSRCFLIIFSNCTTSQNLGMHQLEIGHAFGRECLKFVEIKAHSGDNVLDTSSYDDT